MNESPNEFPGGVLLEDVANGVELAADRECERAEGDNDAHRDHSQDDAILGHRLTLLALSGSSEQIDPVAERHVVTPPFERSEGRGQLKIGYGTRRGSSESVIGVPLRLSFCLVPVLNDRLREIRNP